MNGREAAETRAAWAWTTVGEMATTLRGVTYKKEDARSAPSDGLVPILRAGNLNQHLDFDDLVYVPCRYVSLEQMLKPGDIVIAASSGSKSVVGKAAQLRTVWEGSFGAFCLALRPVPDVNATYLSMFLQTEGYRQRVSNLAAGVNINNLRREHVESTPLPLPPLAEQHRIVAEIEKQFTRLDAGVAALERVRANLKRYRAAVLKAAVEGRLVPTEAELARAEGRGYETGAELLARVRAKLELRPGRRHGHPNGSPPAIGAESMHILPEGWTWALLPELGELNRGVSKHRPRNDPRLLNGAYPFVQTGDVRHSGGFIRSHSGTYSEFGLAQSRLWPAGTVCITIAANIAETGILTYPACFPDSVVGFLFDGDAVTTSYVEKFMRTAKEDLARYAPATAQKNINLETLSRLAIALPPEAEQHRLVAEVEQRLSLADELEATVNACLRRAERLRQAILKHAFEGKLLPQDPSDEPASVLLERIRSEREAGAAQPRRARQPKAAAAGEARIPVQAGLFDSSR